MTETRKLSTIIFADIQGYTQLMQRDEEKGLEMLKSFEQILKSLVPSNGGQIVQYFGDGCLISFDSASKGTRIAIKLQQKFINNLIPVRIGIHVGDVIFREGNVFGDGVNIASRIESFGVPGSILISKNVRDYIKSKSEFNVVPISKIEFKNVDEDVEVYALANEGLIIPNKKDLVGKGRLKSKSNPYIIYFFVLIIIVFLGSLLNYQFQNNVKTNVNKIDKENLSIAVLPLINLNSSDENLEYFSDGLSQEIIDELSQVRVLTMIAFTTTIRYKGSNMLNSSIAEELNAKYLISGTSRIYDNGDSIKISLELLDPVDNKRIWNNTYTELMENAPRIQNKIAKQVSESLNLELSSEEIELLEQPNTTSGKAYRLFLLARSEFFKLNKDGFERSIEILQEVIQIDENFAQAHTFLAWAYQLASNPWFDGHINKSIKELNEYVSPIIKKSIELDDSNSDIYLVRGHQSAFLEGLLRNAKEDVDYALELNSWPIVPTTYCMCIVVSTYVALDDIEPAADLIEVARKLDPGSVFLEWDAANVLMKKGQFKEAHKLYKDAALTAPVSMFKNFLGWSYYHNNEYTQARDLFLKNYSESLIPTSLNVAYLSNTYFKLGDIDSSNIYLNELIKRDSAGEHHLNLYISSIFLERGNFEAALDYLEDAWSERNWGIALFISLDPSFKKLESDPRFIKIKKEMQYYKS